MPNLSWAFAVWWCWQGGVEETERECAARPTRGYNGYKSWWLMGDSPDSWPEHPGQFHWNCPAMWWLKTDDFLHSEYFYEIPIFLNGRQKWPCTGRSVIFLHEAQKRQYFCTYSCRSLVVPYTEELISRPFLVENSIRQSFETICSVTNTYEQK